MSKFEKPIPICSFLPIFALSLTTDKGPAKFYKIDQNRSKSGTSANTHLGHKYCQLFFRKNFWSVCRWVGWCFIVSSFILAPTCVGHVRIDGGAASCCAQTDQKIAGPLTLLSDDIYICHWGWRLACAERTKVLRGQRSSGQPRPTLLGFHCRANLRLVFAAISCQ